MLPQPTLSYTMKLENPDESLWTNYNWTLRLQRVVMLGLFYQMIPLINKIFETFP